jgi:hypothetical protein
MSETTTVTMKETLWSAINQFASITGDRPSAIYLGFVEHERLCAELLPYEKPTEFMGYTIFCVCEKNHLAVIWNPLA